MRPNWAEVSLPALRANFRRIQEHVGPEVTVCAVVKADAYGHGAIECARALVQEGATWLGVTSTEEGVRLREAGIRARILLMTGLWRGEQEEVVRHALTPAVWQVESLDLLAQALKNTNEPFPVHVKIDTGMARLGVPHSDAAQFAAELQNHPQLEVEGIFTHLASSEVVDASSNELQSARFDEACAVFRAAGVRPHYEHVANSAAIAARPAAWHNFVRPGISLYGYYLPFLSSSGRPVEMRGLPVEPVLAWKTRIIGLRQVGPNQPIGYNEAYVTRRAATIGVLPVGYADGLSRQLSSEARVLVRGEFAPVVGNVSMDVTLIDVSEIKEAQVGDEVVLIGRQGGHAIDAWEHATLARTIPYEVLCNISKRVPRVHLG
jgi:alanine racemase